MSASAPRMHRRSIVLTIALLLGGSIAAEAAKPSVLEHEPLFGAGDPDPAASGNPLLVPIPEDAVTDVSSELYVARFLSEMDAGGFRMQLGSSAYPVYYTSDDPENPTPGKRVTLTALSGSGAWGYCGKKWIEDVPIPSFVEADPSTDGRMIVVDRPGQCVYDFWGYGDPLIVPGDPKPRAWWVSALPMDSIGVHAEGEIGAGRAANFMAANGLVWPDELAAGHIPHAISFGYAADAILERSWVAPATRSDGSSLDIDALPEGARLQLNPAIDLSTLGLDPHLVTIGRALQEYGMFLADGNGGGVALGGVSGLSADPNPWTLVPGMPDPLPSALTLVELRSAAEAALPEGEWLFRVLELGDIRSNVPPICPNNPCATYTAPAPCTGCCAEVADPAGGAAAPVVVIAALATLGLLWGRRRRRLALLLGASLVLGASACIPDEPTGPWSLYPGAIGANDTGSTPGVVVAGDSLVYGLPVQEMANSIRFWTGSSAVVAAAGGASTAHYTKESLIGPAGLTTIANYVSFFQPRITVVALGSNDARILEAQAGQPGGYVLEDYQGALSSVLDQGLRNGACVIVVNVARHWTPSMAPYIDQVNAKIDALAAQKGARARVADWESHSAGQPWFLGAYDIHHNAAGKAAYRDFITGAVGDAIAAGC